MGAFHAYDIRGLYGSEITPALAYGVGRLFGEFRKARRVLVAYDARLHSKELYDQVIEGLLDAGADVVGLGLSSTPQMHFFQMREKCDAGIMVTASHNPRDYHGFKLFDAVGGSVSYAKGLDKIEAALPTVAKLEKKKRGALKPGPSIDAYIDFLAGLSCGKKFSSRIVIDTANGSSGPVFMALAKKLGLDAVFLNSEPDGRFPNHDPNPLKDESRIQISEAVKSHQADLGVIMDGDGDRIIFVDEKGRAIEN
ncbi:MAG: phosphomannomutase, partial [Spirochaetaceae bacterium]